MNLTTMIEPHSSCISMVKKLCGISQCKTAGNHNIPDDHIISKEPVTNIICGGPKFADEKKLILDTEGTLTHED